MALVGKDAAMGGYRQTGVSIVIMGSDTGCPAFWSGFMGSVGHDYE